MKHRCIVCGRLFDQILASQKTCSGVCERMKVSLPSEPDEAAIEQRPRIESAHRVCTHSGCDETFHVERKRGRPPVKCPKHRRTAA